MIRALLPELFNLPDILNEYKQHLRECYDCYNLAIQLKGQNVKAKSQLELITRITEMHTEKEIRPRLLGKDKMVYLKIPELLWEDYKYFLAEHKKRIDKYVVTESYYQKATSPSRKAREPLTKEAAEAFAKAVKESKDRVIQVSVLDEIDAPPDLSKIFAPFNRHASDEIDLDDEKKSTDPNKKT